MTTAGRSADCMLDEFLGRRTAGQVYSQGSGRGMHKQRDVAVTWSSVVSVQKRTELKKQGGLGKYVIRFCHAEFRRLVPKALAS